MERIKEKKQLLTDKEIRSILPVAGLTVCAVLILAVSTDTFLSRQNLLNLFAKAASSQVMALGMALVLLSGYFDLTGGAVVVLSLVGCFNILPVHIFPAGTEILWVLAVGILLGALSGTFVVYCKMPSLLTSLVLIQIFRGLAFKLSEGDKISEMSRPFRWIGTVVTSGGIPVAAILVLLLTVIMQVILQKTVLGYHARGIGVNAEIAETAGVPVKKVVWKLYVFAGFFYGVSAILLAGRVGVISSSLADGQEMRVLAGVVLGGCSLSGGKGSFFGCYLGVLFLTIIDNAINLLNISSYWGQFLQGIIIFTAIWLDTRINYAGRRKRI